MQPLDECESFSCEIVNRSSEESAVVVLLEVRPTGLQLRDASTKQAIVSIGINALQAWSTRDTGFLYVYATNASGEGTERWTLRTADAVEIAAAFYRIAEAEAARGGANVARLRGASVEEVGPVEGTLGVDDPDGNEGTLSFFVEVAVPSGTSPARLEVSYSGITLLRDLATGCNVQFFDIDGIASWKYTPTSFIWCAQSILACYHTQTTDYHALHSIAGMCPRRVSTQT